jgi:hypothetical protein
MTPHALSTSPVTISYRNYTNVSFPFMRGYEPGDTMVTGWSGTIDADTLEVHSLAEQLFSRHNRDDRPDGQLCPSMSVGDVVVIGETALTVEGIGFSICSLDPADVVESLTWRQYLDANPRY